MLRQRARQSANAASSLARCLLREEHYHSNPGKRPRLTIRTVLLGLGLLAALGAGAWYGDYWWTTGRFIVSTDDAYVGAHAAILEAKVSGYMSAIDAILQRVKASGLYFGSAPWSIDDGKLNDWNGGRGFYFKNPDGHILELMTVPQ
jgi:hypothetical protein